MTSENESAHEADLEAVVEQAEETPEEVENTEGQEQEDPPAEDEGKEPDAEDKPSPAALRRKRRKATQERLIQETADAKAEAARLKAELARTDQELQSNTPPKEADFESYEEYQSELMAFKAVQAFEKRQQREVSRQYEATEKRLSDTDAARQRELFENWTDQLAEARTKYADFDTVFNDSLPVSKETAEMLAGSDVGTDVAYYLGQNPKEAAQIASLSPLEQARRIGAIESRVALTASRKPSSAPDPITPIKGGGGTPKSPTDMTVDEYREWRQSGGKF